MLAWMGESCGRQTRQLMNVKLDEIQKLGSGREYRGGDKP